MSFYVFDMPLLCRAIGVVGSVIYVGGFAALQMHWIESKGLAYSLSKIVGALFILVSLSVDFNLASAITQLCFLSFGLYGLTLRLKDRNAPKRSAAEWGGNPKPLGVTDL
ncbi:CBU_0592 family membrane protein [Celeribacter neptunius]|uniref:CBU-0592-like domain-containing protein n=1 Tax=Celeribacter neptunius TaxID=588602 RepID=A0A1I3PH93_9RHOB|nr:hypothetical protein [Celeribacter neptunius]SFJ20717.1 hypothetical protein SAMN04487991_1675 [Celeribacter neptunius]